MSRHCEAKGVFRGARIVAAVVGCLVGTMGVAADDELTLLTRAALEHNPAVLSAQHRLRQARFQLEGKAGFRDPSAVALLGWSVEGRRVPGVSRPDAMSASSGSVEAGVEVPVWPGVYLGAGVAERRLFDLEDYEDLYQTEAGIQLRVPLWRDRGFAGWRHEEAEAEAVMAEAEGAWLRVCQDLCRDLEARHIRLLQAEADFVLAQEATRRVEQLLHEAEQMMELGVLPSYQIHAARLEVSLHQERESAARSEIAIQRRYIAELVGPSAADLFSTDVASDLTALGQQATLPLTNGVASVYLQRGLYLEARARLIAQQARVCQAENDERSDLSLRAAYTWQGEDASRAWGNDAIVTDERDGVEAILVWRHTLGNRERRAETAARRARTDELAEELRRIEWHIAAARDVAQQQFESAVRRLGVTTESVREARAALDAEDERFRAGEGTSRLVLDAQKHLTDAVRQQNTIAAELLLAQLAYRHAVGMVGLSTQSTKK